MFVSGISRRTARSGRAWAAVIEGCATLAAITTAEQKRPTMNTPMERRQDAVCRNEDRRPDGQTASGGQA
jgi:hypothetical protein